MRGAPQKSPKPLFVSVDLHLCVCNASVLEFFAGRTYASTDKVAPSQGTGTLLNVHTAVSDQPFRNRYYAILSFLRIMLSTVNPATASIEYTTRLQRKESTLVNRAGTKVSLPWRGLPIQEGDSGVVLGCDSREAIRAKPLRLMDNLHNLFSTDKCTTPK